MNINFLPTTSDCFIAVIDNYYDEQELVDIKKEVASLLDVAKQYNGQQFSAFDGNGSSKRKGSSVFLDDIFEEKRHESKVLQINRKLFSKEVADKLEEKSLNFRHIKNSNRDISLLSYYEDGDYYKSHADSSIYTAISFFELEKFSGGELSFDEFSIKIESIDNRVVVFPGFLLHKVSEVTGGIRASLSQFVLYGSYRG